MQITNEERQRRKELMDLGLKPCSKCGKILSIDCFSKNKNSYDGLSSCCKECYKESFKKYYEENGDKKRKYSKEYRKNNHEKVLEDGKKYRELHPNQNKEYYHAHKDERRESKKSADKKYYVKNKEKLIEHQRQYRIDNEEKVKYQRKQHYEENREEILSKKKDYRETHKEERKQWLQSERGKASSRLSHEKRRFREENNGGSFSLNDILCALSFFDNKCAYTGEPLEDNYHLDHIIPVSKGGTNYIWNIVPCNSRPNCSKHARDMEQWFREQEYFSEDKLEKIYRWIDIKQKEIKGEAYSGQDVNKEAS